MLTHARSLGRLCHRGLVGEIPADTGDEPRCHAQHRAQKRFLDECFLNKNKEGKCLNSGLQTDSLELVLGHVHVGYARGLPPKSESGSELLG